MPSFLEFLGRAQPITKGIEFLEERQKTKELLESARIERGFKERQIKALDYQLAEVEKQKQRDETPMDVEAHLKLLNIPNANEILEDMKKQGVIDVRNIGKKGDIKNYTVDTFNNYDKFKWAFEPIVRGHKDKYNQALQAYQEAVSNPKSRPEDIQKALEIVKVNLAQYEGSLGKFEGTSKILFEKAKEQDITGQFITDKGITVGFSDTGGAIAYERDSEGKIVQMPYDEKKHGKKPDKEKEEKYDKNLLVAAQAAGINPNKVMSGKLTSDEAEKLGAKYREMFGAENAIKALLQIFTGGQTGGAETPAPIK